MRTRDLLAFGEEILKKAGLSKEEARREALLTLGHLLEKRPLEVYLVPEVSEETASRLLSILKKRAQGVPLAYLLGEVEFFGRRFLVSSGVLIPRPETEILVESVLKHLQKGPLLELGVGSGCVSLTLALEAPELEIFGVEKSHKALRVALENRKRWGLEKKVHFVLGDWLTPFKKRPFFKAVVSNPPYVAEEEWPFLPPEVREHEPREALVGGKKGLSFIKRTLKEAPAFLIPGGFVFLEIGYQQRKSVEELALQLGYRCLWIQDLLGHARVLVARLKADPELSYE